MKAWEYWMVPYFLEILNPEKLFFSKSNEVPKMYV